MGSFSNQTGIPKQRPWADKKIKNTKTHQLSEQAFGTAALRIRTQKKLREMWGHTRRKEEAERMA